MKYIIANEGDADLKSRPARGAWVEIEEVKQLWLELQSRPARGAWVEIDGFAFPSNAVRVAPRKGRVG